MKNSPEALKPLFQLDPEITFLNHGSYGSCPKPVFEVYQDWQRKLEAQPIKFMSEDVYDHLETSRHALGQYLNCSMDDLVYVPNPTPRPWEISFIIWILLVVMKCSPPIWNTAPATGPGPMMQNSEDILI